MSDLGIDTFDYIWAYSGHLPFLLIWGESFQDDFDLCASIFPLFFHQKFPLGA